MWLNEYSLMVVVMLFGWSVCMKLLVRRGTSWHKGVVVIRGSNCCHGVKV